MAFAGQVLSGSEFAYSGTYVSRSCILGASSVHTDQKQFFQQAGMSAEDAYKLGLGGTAIAFIGTMIAWVLMNRFGRRQVYMGGLMSMCCCLITIGFLTLPRQRDSLVWAQSGLCIVWLFSFSLSVGPVGEYYSAGFSNFDADCDAGWVMPSEVSSTRLRSKTVVLARNTYYITNMCANIIQPYMVSPTQPLIRPQTNALSLTGVIILDVTA